MIKIVGTDALNLADHIKPGAFVSWGQGSGEPLALVEKLIQQRHQIGEVKAFVGLSFSGLLEPGVTDMIKPCSFGALGTNLALAKAGVLELIATSFSAINGHIKDRRLPLDTIFVQLSPAGSDGSHSLGFCNDFLITAMAGAKLVIGEINPNVPCSKMDAPLDETLIDFAIESDRPVANLKTRNAPEALASIGANVAELISEGATIQYGIGILPEAILKALSGHRNLGLHNGLITEGVIDLVSSGVINNSRKEVDTGLSVAAFCIGGEKLCKFLHGNQEFCLYPSSYTHSPKILSQLDNLVAINSALEVDFYGQVNAEQIGDNYLGAIGGQVDFMHAASTCTNGLAIIALPSTTGPGQSRIVARLNGPYVTTARVDVDVIVTEFGVADLRGRSDHQRGLAICAIGAPQHRDRLRHEFLSRTNS